MNVMKKCRSKRTNLPKKPTEMDGMNIDRFLINREMRQKKYRSLK